MRLQYKIFINFRNKVKCSHCYLLLVSYSYKERLKCIGALSTRLVPYAFTSRKLLFAERWRRGEEFTSFEGQANRGFSSGIRVCYYISTSLSLPPVSLFLQKFFSAGYLYCVIAMPFEF